MVAKVLLMLLRIYQRWISPLYPARCRYVPTCSQYAVEAIKKYGALRGTWMAVWRVLRCHPWSRGGYDPVS
ncbi:MAG TPA: membrane protein insertion efficiency factor YidD [bacterium]|nr:membrane protein insertion efficiency factor YidD [bacterium]